MATFTDRNSRTWTLRLTISRAEAIKDRLNLDLADPEFRDLIKLEGDSILTARTIFLLIDDNPPPDPDDFFDAFDGDTFDAAAKALIEAVSDFFPPARKSLLSKLRETTEAAIDRQLAKAMARISDPALIEKIEAAADRKIEKQLEAAMSSFDGPTPSAESSGSRLDT